MSESHGDKQSSRRISFLKQQQLYLKRELSHFKDPTVFLYTGQNRSEIPDDVVHVKIDDSVKVLPSEAFSECKQMITIEFNDGLERIEGRAFVNCHSLRNPQIPPTVRSIGDLAFSNCLGLYSLDLPEGLETIGRAAFPSCSFRNVKIPSSMTEVGEKTFSCCTDLFSVEVPDRVTAIRDEAFFQCLELRNVAIPDTVTKIGDGAFEYCLRLQDKFPHPYDLLEALKKRFHGKPVHKVCYYQSHYNLDDTLSVLKLAIKADRSKDRQDTLGMTPVHILSLSKKQDLELHRKLVCTYPEDLLIEDEWGCLPIYYACLCDASLEIVRFLLKAHKKLFSDHKLGWEKIIDSFSIMFVSTEVIRYVVHWSITDRLHCLNYDRWQADVVNEIQNIPGGGRKTWKERDDQIRRVHRKLSRYEIKELTSLLEMAAWKAKLDGSENENDDNEEFRRHCRHKCGAEHMISNVLSFVDKIF